MSDFNSRRFPNFSQYLDDLNTIPSPYDQAVQQQQQDSFNIDAELSLFTNAEFFDFDNLGDLNLPTFDSVEDGSSTKDTSSNEGQKTHMKFMDFLNGEFNTGPSHNLHPVLNGRVDLTGYRWCTE